MGTMGRGLAQRLGKNIEMGICAAGGGGTARHAKLVLRAPKIGVSPAVCLRRFFRLCRGKGRVS